MWYIRLHVKLPKNLFAEFLFAEKYCFNFAENFICGIADLPNFYLPNLLQASSSSFPGNSQGDQMFL
jgi:hypothetical protein